MNVALNLARPNALTVEAIAPVAVRALAEGLWFADFGRAAFGTVRLTVAVPCAVRLTVHLGEKLTADGRLDRQPPGCVRYRTMALEVPAGLSTHQIVIPADSRNTGPMAIRMPAELFEVLPFRYAEVAADGVPFVLHDLRQLAVYYPFDEGASGFRSSDDGLNRVWSLCKYSIKATSFCGVYVDGDRERIPYEGDAYINQLCHYGVDAEYELARHSLEYLLFHPTWPTEWILHCLPMAWADYEYTGKADLLAAYYEVLRRKALPELARGDGLISTATGLVTPSVLDGVFLKGENACMRDLVDWPPGSFTQGGTGERDHYDMAPVNTVVNAFHAWNLRLLGKVAALLNKPDDARLFGARHGQVVASLERACFRADQGVFCDGEGSTHVSLHANMFPAALGLIPDGRARDVLAFIRSRGMACSVYGAQYLLEACYRLGAADDALALMTADHDRGWLNMLKAGSTVTLEAWDHRYKNNLDWNHAWGAAPANIIPRFLVGVRPALPGFANVCLAPQPGGLAGFEAVVPTCRGPVAVALETLDSGRRRLRFESAVPVMLDLAGLGSRLTGTGRYRDYPAGPHEIEVENAFTCTQNMVALARPGNVEAMGQEPSVRRGVQVYDF